MHTQCWLALRLNPHFHVYRQKMSTSPAREKRARSARCICRGPLHESEPDKQCKQLNLAGRSKCRRSANDQRCSYTVRTLVGALRPTTVIGAGAILPLSYNSDDQ